MSKEEWASNNYDVGHIGYDGSPLYAWNKKFRVEKFKQALEIYNTQDSNGYQENLEYLIGEDATPPGLFLPCWEVLIIEAGPLR